MHAGRLLAGYTSPFSGAKGADNPVVFAGMVVSNSETGHGSFSITPRIVAQVCDNGMTITATRCARSTWVVAWTTGSSGGVPAPPRPRWAWSPPKPATR